MLAKFTESEGLAQIGEEVRTFEATVHDANLTRALYDRDLSQRMLLGGDPEQDAAYELAVKEGMDELGFTDFLQNDDCARLTPEAQKHFVWVLENAVRYGALYGNFGDVKVNLTVCRAGIMLILEDPGGESYFGFEQFLGAPDVVQDKLSSESHLRRLSECPDVQVTFERVGEKLRTMLLYVFDTEEGPSPQLPGSP